MASLALSGIGASLALTATPVMATISVAFVTGAAVAGVVTLIGFRRKRAALSSKGNKPVIDLDSYGRKTTTYALELLQEAEEEHIRRLTEMQAEVRTLKLDAFSASDGDSRFDAENGVIHKNPNSKTPHVLRKTLEFVEAEHAAVSERNLRLQAKNGDLEEKARHGLTDIELSLGSIFKQLDTHSKNTEFRLQNLQRCVQVVHEQLTHSEQQLHMLAPYVCVTNVEHMACMWNAEDKDAQAEALMESCNRATISEQRVLAVCHERDELQNQLQELQESAEILELQKDLAQAKVAALKEELSRNCAKERTQETREPTNQYITEEHTLDEDIPNKHVPDKGIPDELVVDESIPDEFAVFEGVPNEFDQDKPSVKINLFPNYTQPLGGERFASLKRARWVQNLCTSPRKHAAAQRMPRFLG